MDLPYNISTERAYPTPYATSPLLPVLLMSLAMQKHSPRTSHEFQDEYDYIVVGAGSAGAVVASRLSELPCVSVLLLEAGKPPPLLTDVPAVARSFVSSDIDWRYFTTPQRYTAASIVGRRMPFPSGKTLGGSSTWNAMLYVRGNRRNYDEWEALGAEGWSYDDVLPYFKKLEDNTEPAFLENGYHARGGPITASRPIYHPTPKLGEIEAILEEGYEFVDPNAREQIGWYDYQGSIRNGQRCGTAKAYLVPSENRTNLDILPRAMVRKVLIEEKKAVGVEFDYGGSTRRVKARREVILSAGTTNTPQLLMLSGIGPMNELKKHNIPLVQDLPVGLNFQDHAATLLAYELDSRITTFDAAIADNSNIRDYIRYRIGPLTAAEGFQLMSFLSNSDRKPDGIPDHSVYFLDFAKIALTQLGLKPEVLAKLAAAAANKTTVTCAVQQLHPISRGTLTLSSSDPYSPPVIDPNYFADYRDIKDMTEGMKICQRIMNNPRMKELGAKPLDFVLPGCEEFLQDEELYFRCIVRSLVFTANHQVGTARMGDPRDASTVVDPQLRVLGIRRLRVVDASVMPTIPWSNTNIPTIMVAEKASDIIKSTISCQNYLKTGEYR